MSPNAIETFSTFGVGVLCLALAVMALALFFKAMSWLGNLGAKPEDMAIRGVLKKDTWATVYVTGAKTFDQVRFVGFTNSASIKTHLPYDLDGMVILEDRHGKRYLIRAKAIRMIVIPSEREGGEKGEGDESHHELDGVD